MKIIVQQSLIWKISLNKLYSSYISGVLDLSNRDLDIALAPQTGSAYSQKQFTVHVGSGGTTLEVEYVWPEVLKAVKHVPKFKVNADGWSNTALPSHREWFSQFMLVISKERRYYPVTLQGEDPIQLEMNMTKKMRLRWEH